MKHAFVLALLLLGLSITGSAQRSREQIAGEWVINAKKTAERDVVAGAIWNISIESDVITIRRSAINSDVTMKLFTTGKGESNDIYATGTVLSKTKWEGGKLVRTFFMASPMFRPSRATENVEVYRVSKDGKTLTYELSAKMEGGYPEPILVRNLVFDRKP